MVEVRIRFPEVLLLIVGNVADQRPVNLVKQLDLEDIVVFTGEQPHANVSVYHA
jgi:glycosyltransferase involved in cell wall biosynthesis